MMQSFNRQWEKPLTIIHPGEFFSSNEDILISTVLGSCVSVILYDEARHFGGMNHFMLPNSGGSGKNLLWEESGRYGAFAMELLINDMIKKGGMKSSFVAKVFGGGHVLKSVNINNLVSNVPQNNIDFALEYLENEKIPIVSKDVGGDEGRKIFLFAKTGKVMLKRIAGQGISEVVKEETDYQKTIKKPGAAEGGVVFFS